MKSGLGEHIEPWSEINPGCDDGFDRTHERLASEFKGFEPH